MLKASLDMDLREAMGWKRGSRELTDERVSWLRSSWGARKFVFKFLWPFLSRVTPVKWSQPLLKAPEIPVVNARPQRKVMYQWKKVNREQGRNEHGKVKYIGLTSMISSPGKFEWKRKLTVYNKQWCWVFLWERESKHTNPLNGRSTEPIT